jgi:hypothetical protein
MNPRELDNWITGGGDPDPGDDDCEGTDADDSTYFAAVEAGHPSLFPLEQE